ncbi:hypothetical protein [Streptomyces spinoverrucosus]|nr:hypothetical protein [Streptomyces spinoverrucosus]GHB53481.1 hypothetical protein GCM10010397_24380 [Streptomyces spinoverrucosus]
MRAARRVAAVLAATAVMLGALTTQAAALEVAGIIIELPAV